MPEIFEKIVASFYGEGLESPAEALYSEYLDGESAFKTEYEKAVADISRRLDGVADGLLLGEYEEAARRAGFFAGPKAASVCLAELFGGR